MLTALHLGNFKAFGETQTIPLRPLTLIFGPNSSGKSSIIHGLLLMYEALRSPDVDIRFVRIGDDLVDLGGFWQFVHRRDFGRDIECGLDVSSPETGSRARLFKGAKHLSLRYTIGSPTHRDSYLQHPLADVFNERQDLDADRLPLFQNRIGSGDVTLLSERYLAEHRSILRLNRHDDGSLRAQLDEGVGEILRRGVEYFAGGPTASAGSTAALDKLIREKLSGLKFSRALGNTIARPKEMLDPEEPPPLGRGARERAARLRWAVARAVREITVGIELALVDEFEKLHYLGPLRSYPPRFALSGYGEQGPGLGSGREAFDAARRDPKTREAINKWLADEKRLSTPYELVAQNLWTMQEIRDRIGLPLTLHEFVDSGVLKIVEAGKSFWSSETKFVLESGEGEKPRATKGRPSRSEVRSAAQALEDAIELLAKEDREAETEARSRRREMYLLDKRTNTLVTHRDVGLGISQILPVLVNAFGLTNQTIAVEQPEIHLHPALQAELADVFIESALGERKNMFILETHSEHLILRVLRRIRETTDGEIKSGLVPIRPEDVAVLYVSPAPEGSKVIEIPIRPDGEFGAPWPDGFFPDRAKELF